MKSEAVFLTVANRRTMLTAGVAAAAGLAGLSAVTAQDATPSPAASDGLAGAYAVIRTYTLAEGADVEALTGIVQDGYVPIIQAVEGFLLYTIISNPDARSWNAIGYFTDKAGAEASTAAAADFVQANDLGSYFENPTPVVSDGTVVIVG